MRPPPDLSQRESHIDYKYIGCFKTPVSSFLSFIPLRIFNAFAVHSNMYAHNLMGTAGNNQISGARWTHDITLQEMVIFWNFGQNGSTTDDWQTSHKMLEQ
jgi:hypothetical protein